MDLAIKYFDELKNTKEFKRLLELKKIIDEKYIKEIISFKTKESLYLESKDNKYYPDKDKIKLDYMNAKTNLYNKEEVREYLLLQEKLNDILDNDFKEIKKSISIEL